MVESHHQLSLTAEDAAALAAPLEALVGDSGIAAVLLVDRAGQILGRAGSAPGLDVVTFATLAAADFNANEQLAQLVGERQFRTLAHRGQTVSVLIEDVGGRGLLVAMFTKSVEVGLVRLAASRTARELASVLDDVARRTTPATHDVPALLAGAEEEIDQMFDW